ncbi:MAG TPA: hypothetical protein VLG50_05210 [Candidatus Saccharimonadales bacterium]|nr:hypothetical protein [Candidatus Saccharimonadales bacterium]
MGLPGFVGAFIFRAAKNAILKHGQWRGIVDSISIDLNGLLHKAFQMVYTITIQQKIEQLKKDKLVNESEALEAQYKRGLKLIEEGFIRDGTNIVEERFLMKRIGLSEDAIVLLNQLYLKTLWDLIINVSKEFGDIHTLILAVDSVSNAAKMKQQRQRRFKSAQRNDPSIYFDSNVITPGTDFMIMVDEFLRQQISVKRHLLPERVIYSSHLTSEGEGEHVIAELFRQNIMANLTNYHVVYSLDADTIFISLLSPQSKIILSRESQEDMIDIDQLKQYLKNRMRSNHAINDFTVLMFLLGNDFLPNHTVLETSEETINLLLDIYAENQYNFINTDKTIDLNQLYKFIQQLAKEELPLLQKLSKRDDFYTTPLAAAKQIGFNVNLYREAYYKKSLTQINNPTDLDIKKMVMAYMKTICWNFKYYTGGHHAVDQGWYYKYYYSPMLVDLAIYGDIEIAPTSYTSYPGMLSYNALHQLITVIPKTSISIIPPELQFLYQITSPIYDLFPTTFINDHEGKIIKKREGRPLMDHGIALIPIPDRQRIIDVVNLATITPDRLKLWEKQDLLTTLVNRPPRRFQQPSYQQSNYQPRYQQQSYQTGYQQTGYQQPSYQPGYQQPGYQQPGYQQPSYQQPSYQQPSYQPRYQKSEYQLAQSQSKKQPKLMYQPKQPKLNVAAKEYVPVTSSYVQPPNMPSMINLNVMQKYIETGQLPKSAKQQLFETAWI